MLDLWHLLSIRTSAAVELLLRLHIQRHPCRWRIQFSENKVNVPVNSSILPESSVGGVLQQVFVGMEFFLTSGDEIPDRGKNPTQPGNVPETE